jgi:mono/diheme cytochrome c family protein
MLIARRPASALLLLAALLPACAFAPGAGKPSCPQPRATFPAPDEFLQLRNPITESSFDRERARRIFETNDGGGCIACHGTKGDGRGKLGARLAVPPRNFTCRPTMERVPDGQLFWVIRNGSAGTPMSGHAELSDEETWQVVRYIREFAR